MSIIKRDLTEKNRILYLLQGDPDEQMDRELKDLPAPVFSREKDWSFKLKVLHINDFHNEIGELDDEGQFVTCLPGLYKIVEEKRKNTGLENEDLLFLSAGDEMIGSIWDYLSDPDEEDDHCSTAYHFLSRMGLDASVTGNHNFDNGCDHLRRAIERDAAFPVLCSNVFDAPRLEGALFPAVIYELKGFRLGILGLMTMGQNRARVGSEYRVGDPLESIQPWIKLLKKHCDGLILISHLGLKLGSEFAEVIKYGDKELAEALPPGALDMIVSGHTHDVEQAEYNQTPIAQVGSNASHLGEVDLIFTEHGSRADILPAIPLEKTIDDGPFFNDEIMPFLQEYSPFIQAPISSQKGFCSEDEILEDSKGKLESPTADFLCEALYSRLRKQGVPVDFTAIDGSNINEVLFCNQTLSLKSLFSLIPYSDTVKTLTMKADELLLFIKDNARRVRVDGEPWKEKGFVYFSESITYRIDSYGEAVDIRFDGRELESLGDKVFTMGITSYMRGLARPWETREQREGRDFYHFPLSRAEDIGLSFRQQIIDYLKETAPCK